jgi:hypothetical protein
LEATMATNAPAELAVRVLHLGTFAHLQHFQTPSYAAHKALEQLYEELPDLIDTYIEQYQGLYGKIKTYPTWSPVLRPIAGMAKDLVKWIDDNREDLTDGDISLDNAIADIRSSLLQAQYRLNELS